MEHLKQMLNSPGSQASAPAYYGPDAGGHSSPDAQEQVSDKHRRIPEARLPHPVLTDTLLAQPHTQEAKLPRSASKWTLLICYASGHSAADTDGETEGGKKIRRRLPPVPLDQEPVRRTKDRTRTLSMGAMPLSSSASDRTWERRRPQRTTSLDDGMALTTATTTSSDLDFLGLTTSTDTYLQFLSSTLFGPTTTTSTTSVLASIPSSIGMSTTSLLGRRDLSAPHSLSSYMRGSSYLLESEGPKLPSYITSLKQQLRDELRSVTEQRRRITDPDLSGLLSHTPWTADPYERKLGTSTLPPVGGSRLSGAGLRRARHRRHVSDTRLPFPASSSAFGRDTYDDPLYRYKLYHPSSSMPFKSFEFESIDDHLRSDGLRTSYPRRNSLTDAPKAGVDSPALRRYNRDMQRRRWCPHSISPVYAADDRLDMASIQSAIVEITLRRFI
ncbi:uncharacterized protein CDAR_423841 [Caerostris darwini]|uniref:Uncharacterized protein n=1 Tax=Caerostris darwini TaxID=1538125 RepID=A0AAV4WAM6_9ARAC|nr:uncharacterized protein CDAR_423841 [Caerostris darwini]